MGKITEHYGELVFNADEMQRRLSSETFESYMDSINNGANLQESVAIDIARAVKDWAIDNGASHFSHWFQPQRSGTAEKHDAFINYNGDGHVIEKFSTSQLIQSEPDASSFPSGGIRSTFEARGYTAWDPKSPMFIRDEYNVKSLIIPSIYLSWTGEALDMKTPLHRSIDALNTQAIKLQSYWATAKPNESKYTPEWSKNIFNSTQRCQSTARFNDLWANHFWRATCERPVNGGPLFWVHSTTCQ